MKGKERIFFNRIKHYREMIKASQGDLAKYMGIKRNTVATDEGNSGSNIGANLSKIYSYIDAFEELSRNQTNGKQILVLSIDDLFYSN